MNYSEPLINQVTVFFRSVGAGIILGIIYDLLCFVRTVLGEKKSIYVTFDIIFAITASVVSFFFMVLYNTGQVRFNLMVGELLGGLAFHLSIGRYFLGSTRKYVLMIKRAVSFLFSPLRKIRLKAVSYFKNKASKRKEKKQVKKNVKKTGKKFINIRKSPLKNKNKSV